MFFLKKLMLGLGFIFLISLGGAGTQSDSLLMQGMGFIGLLIGLVIIYVFWRMVWKGLGCFPSFIIISGIALFMMYTLGFFNNGLDGFGRALYQFLGHNEETQSETNSEESSSSQSNKAVFSEDFSDDADLEEAEDQNEDIAVSPNLFEEDEPEKKAAQPQKNIIKEVVQTLGGSGANTQKQDPRPFNPNDYPALFSSARVINGDTLEIYGKTFYLFGIDAPESNQTCANKQGRAYSCGQAAASWLKGWIGDNELECHIIKQDTKGNMIGTCALGPYDLGAALVNAGWAVANPQHSDIYVAYELQAQANKRGLWQGTFYMPWDWRKLQARKPKIKVIRPKQRKNGIFG